MYYDLVFVGILKDKMIMDKIIINDKQLFMNRLVDEWIQKAEGDYTSA
ncbi:MAG: hypothetical protein GXO75_06385 [Calditrichaeota bacterium]|nr:hypothetical protein [Calditrichota bacterium]